MKKWKGIALFLLCCVAGQAQTDTALHLLKTYKLPVAAAVLDNLDNLYLITKQDQLKKFDAKGDSVAQYNNVARWGKLYHLDVSNPLQLLLFYKDFSSIVILDRLLSVRGTLDLRRYNVLQPTAAGLSYDNNIWLFDAYDNKLKKLDEQGNLLLETPDFRQWFSQPVAPQQILDRDGWVYLYDPAVGALVFDYYGTYKRTVAVRNWSSLFVKGAQVFGIANGTLHSYSTTTLLENSRPFPQPFLPYTQYSLSNNRLLAFGPDSLSIFSYRY